MSWGLIEQIRELKERVKALEVALEIAVSEIPDPSDSLCDRLRNLYRSKE